MLICPSNELRKKAKRIRWFGIDREKKISNNWAAYRERKMTFDIQELGAKRQMNDIAAAMGIVSLDHYDDVIARRKNSFIQYQTLLAGAPGIKILGGVNDNKYWLLTVLVERRDDFARMMFERFVDVNTVHVRNDIYKIFGGKRANLPVMNELEDKYICLPIGPHVSIEDVEHICNCIKRGW